MVDLNPLLKTLCENRPVFHSEADFQHALAWQIHKEWQTYSIRLEYPLFPRKSDHLDILAFDRGNRLAIELKYKTRALFATVNGELFWLKNHSAQDQGRYDFLLDIQELEQFLSENSNTTGYAVLLTNDSSYWTPPRNDSTADVSFRLHEGKIINGALSWGTAASGGTTQGRKENITIKGTYKLIWQDYYEVKADINVSGSRKFRYLSVEVTK